MARELSITQLTLGIGFLLFQAQMCTTMEGWQLGFFQFEGNLKDDFVLT
jgi:hypothetical protein